MTVDDPNVTTYGSNNFFIGNTTDNSYGVYSNVASPGMAGMFEGDVTVTGALYTDGLQPLPAASKSGAKSLGEVIKLTGALDIVMKLQPKRLDLGRGLLNGTGVGESASQAASALKGQTIFGFSPAEVALVESSLVAKVNLPELKLQERKFGEDFEFPLNTSTAGEEFRVVRKGTSKQALRITEFIPILTAAIQEQQAILNNLPLLSDGSVFGKQLAESTENISNLEAEVSDLRSENTQLRETVTALEDRLTILADQLDDLRSCTDCFGDRRPLTPATKPTDMSVYPNPASRFVTVNYPAADGVRFSINVRDANGKAIHRVRSRERVTTIDTANWSAGTYFLEIVQDKQVVAQERVVIVNR